MTSTTATSEFSKKSYTTAVILSAIFGVMGIHHFYVGRWGMGLFDFGLFVLTAYCFFTEYIVAAFAFGLIDLIHTVIVTYLLFVGKYKDGGGKYIPYPGQYANI